MARSSGAEFHVPRSAQLLIAAAAALSWLGAFVHNVADLPGQTVQPPASRSPEPLMAAIVRRPTDRPRSNDTTRPAVAPLERTRWSGGIVDVLVVVEIQGDSARRRTGAGRAPDADLLRCPTGTPCRTGRMWCRPPACRVS